MKLSMLIDFGSTYTKVSVVDLETASLVAKAQAVSTVSENMLISLLNALAQLRISGKTLDEVTIDKKLACSSAAGGLRMIAVGLVPDLTVEAAKRAALGAGAKLVGAYSFQLTKKDISDIEAISPDMILLCGGTDGGNTEVILHNAHMLARSKITTLVLVAGNRVVADEAMRILEDEGKIVEVTENVLPKLNELNVEPAREQIRELFMRRIVAAKGLDKAVEYVGDILMPTPMATLRAAQLLADGTEDEPGLGDLLIVEQGGATANIHSVAKGNPSRSDVVLKGLPEPYAKRTVEGDLGIRYNAPTILDIVGESKLLNDLSEIFGVKESINLKEYVTLVNKNIGHVPRNDMEFAIDSALSRAAVRVAVSRHCGQIQEVHTTMGVGYLQYGKDLTKIKTVIGTGGIFVNSKQPREILEGALFDSNNPMSLRPQAPDLYVDRNYILYGVGLLSSTEPTKALRIAKKSLERLN